MPVLPAFKEMRKIGIAGAVQIAEGDVRQLEPAADDLQHLHELREDQHFVAAFHHVEDHILESLELAGGQAPGGEAGHVHLEQARVATDLAKLEQRVEDGHLALGHALAFDVGQHLIAELPGQGRVEFGLFVRHVAVRHALDLRRPWPLRPWYAAG